VLERDRGLCQVCLLNGRTTLASEVDHIVGKAQGGSDDESNLQAICDTCHDAKTASEKHNGHRGRISEERREG
jgi:5-methylcytosine-specific restriction protein A